MAEGSSRCVCPLGCMSNLGTDPSSKSVIRFYCTNSGCPLDKFMHQTCFQVWQNSSFNSAQVSKCSTPGCDNCLCKSTSADNKGCVNVVYKSCVCPCGKGCLRRDMNDPIKTEEEGKRRRSRRRSGNKLSQAGGNGSQASNFRTRSRTFSIGSTRGQKSNSPTSQHPMAHSLDAAPSHAVGQDFFSDMQVQASGSIFKRRESLSTLIKFLPRWKINGINIKLEDDCPQGNDETRIFVLTSLGDHKRRQMNCVLCRTVLLVYDRYPLIDGTFFLSSLNHAESGVFVKFEGREVYLLALCMVCLENSDSLCCIRCNSSNWFLGNKLVLGTLYTYDVLTVVPCCLPPCVVCKRPVPYPNARYFSYLSELSTCPHCGHIDVHHIRRLDSVRRLHTVRLPS